MNVQLPFARQEIDSLIHQIHLELDPDKKPSFRITESIHKLILEQDIRQILIRYFRTKGSSWNEEFLFVTYDYWKNLELEDWKIIFNGIKGKSLGEYYMAKLAAKYLGIHLEFESTRELSSTSYSFSSGTIETAKTSLFIGYSTGGHLDFYKSIFEPYGLKVEDFIAIKEKLKAEEPIILHDKIDEPKSMIGKIFSRFISLFKKS